MARKKIETAPGNLRIIVYFVVVVVALVSISGAWKFWLLVRESTFDPAYRFTIAVSTRPPRVISFSPDAPVITQLVVTEATDIRQLSSQLGIFVDQSVVGKSAIPSLDVRLLISYLFFHMGDMETKLTVLDLGRFYLLAQTPTERTLVSEEISLSTDQKTVDKLLLGYLADPSVQQENISVAIINATGVSGIGNRVARVIANIGGNVVSVSTGDVDQSSSALLYNGKLSYTARKLSRLFRVSPGELANRNALGNDAAGADIVIVVGKDSLSYVSY